MERVTISSAIKEIGIFNENDELITVLKINTSDSEVTVKFFNIINNLNGLSDSFETEIKKIKKDNDNYTNEDIIEFAKARARFIRNIMNEIDNVFGNDVCASIWGEDIPDELALTEFIEKVIPVMNKLFNERYQMNYKKFNSKRLGNR